MQFLKERTVPHQGTRNSTSEAFSPVYAQEDGLTWQNWSAVLFLLAWRALCLFWSGAPRTHRRAVALPGEQLSSLGKTLVSYWETTADKSPSSQCSQELHGCTCAHTQTPTPWVPSEKGRRPFRITQQISNTIEWSKVHWHQGSFGQCTMELYKSSSIPIN